VKLPHFEKLLLLLEADDPEPGLLRDDLFAAGVLRSALDFIVPRVCAGAPELKASAVVERFRVLLLLLDGSTVTCTERAPHISAVSCCCVPA
jgi:hypothetical protein